MPESERGGDVEGSGGVGGRPPSPRSLRALDAAHFFLADVRDGLGPSPGIFLDRQARNDELPGLFDLIRTRFEMIEVPPPSRRPAPWRERVRSTLRRGARALGLVAPGGGLADPFPFVEHLCRARASAETDAPA